MKVSYERTMGVSYLYIEAPQYLPTFEEKMLKNSIPGLLPFHRENRNGTDLFLYEITQKAALKHYLQENRLDIEMICFLVRNLIEIMGEGRKYLLESCNFLIGTEYIYLGDEGTSLWLCYYMGYQKPVQQQMAELFEEWMKIVDYKDQKAVRLVYELFHLARKETCTYDEIMEVIERTEHDFYLGRRQSADTQGEPDSIWQQEKMDARVIAPRETVTDEKEVLYYPIKNYIILGSVITAGVGILAVCAWKGLLNDPFGQLDLLKTLCCIVVIFAILGYIGVRLFTKEQRCSKMVPVYEDISIHDKLGADWEPKPAEQDKMAGINQKDGEIVEDDLQQSGAESYDKYRDLQSGQKLQHKSTTMEAQEEQETEVLYEEKTEILMTRSVLHLIPESKDCCQLEVSLPEAVIGSSLIQADYCLPYKTVSRCHAKIICRSDHFYLEDLGSTNGTYVNHGRCMPGEEYAVEDGDCIQIAEYTYRVEVVGR